MESPLGEQMGNSWKIPCSLLKVIKTNSNTKNTKYTLLTKLLSLLRLAKLYFLCIKIFI